jgi:hypothetical protein
MAGPFVHPCTRPATASQAREPDSPSGSRPRPPFDPVEEYERDGKAGKKWTKIGAAFPHKEGLGFSIELKAD